MCDAFVGTDRMSGEESRILCRRCNETIRVEDESCPTCGKSIRSTTYLAAGFAFGVVVAAASLTNPGELAFFGVIGLAIAATTGYLLYNKRQRKQRASGSEAEPADVLSEDDGGL
jgi:ribosomal protein L37E